ncbi:hypothetical protein WA026_008742 [Henosepilachna vigintioctopunctata]|uniref:CCHC-type domain-containing protein n=1 Tax=Henosepilachna vigintioctopunctata TaxID=420089 RepID=A0AAW1VD96_9CUCU
MAEQANKEDITTPIFDGVKLFKLEIKKNKEQLIMFRNQRKNMVTSDSDKKNNVSAFASKTKAQCFICGKTGHLKKDCCHGQRHNQG